MGAVDFNPEVQTPSASPVPNSTTTTAENTTMPNVVPIEPATPEPEPEHSYLGSNPAMPDQLYPPQANDPGAFQIPNSNG